MYLKGADAVGIRQVVGGSVALYPQFIGVRVDTQSDGILAMLAHQNRQRQEHHQTRTAACNSKDFHRLLQPDQDEYKTQGSDQQ